MLESGGDGNFVAYHGTQTLINSNEGFLTKYILSGVGDNVFGWGLYFTDVVEVAVSYARNNTSNEVNRLLSLADEFEITSVGEMEDFFQMHDEWDRLSPSLKSLILDPNNANKSLEDLVEKGYLYQVTVRPSKPNVLLWYDNVSDGVTGEQYYNKLKSELGSDEEASAYLYDKGYYGIKYPTGTLINQFKSKGFNYVIFNDDDITINKATRL